MYTTLRLQSTTVTHGRTRRSRACRTSASVGRVGIRVGGVFGFNLGSKSRAARTAGKNTNQVGPGGNHLSVEDVEHKNQESLQRSKDREEDKEDIHYDRERQQEHQITKDPRETDGDEDGQIHTELLTQSLQTLLIKRTS